MVNDENVSFKNIYYDRFKNKVYVREMRNGEEHRYEQEFIRTVYVPDPKGDVKDIFGNMVRRMDVTYEQLKSLRTMFGTKLCESDISEEIKFISSCYYPYGEMKPQYSDFNVCSLDIEVQSPDEFPKPEETKHPINLISFWSSKTGKITTFGNQPYTGDNKDIDYHYHADERELLKDFIKCFRKNKFDIITGWNVINFDIQYIINRCTLLEVDYTKLSPYNTVTGRLGRENMGRRNYYATIAGVSCIDYLDLYKNFTFETRESYTLNFIANFEIGEGKLELEGQVNNEWRDNWNNFVDYNILDVMLVKKIDDKKKFMALAILMAHECLIPIDKVVSAVAVTEGMIIRELKVLNMVMPDRPHKHYDRWKEQALYNSGKGKPNGIENDPDNDDDEEEILENGIFKDFYIKGGHVEAYPNWYKSVLSFDVESEYPHMIMAYNISPETKVFNPSKDVIKRDGLIKSAVNGIYFKKEQGILPRITKKVFDERKLFKDLRDANASDKVLYEYYDSRQHIRKIQVNSIYGVMGSKFFHFYDVDCARATTRGGRQMIRFLAKGFDNYFRNHFHLEFNKLFPERFIDNPQPLNDKVVCLIDTDSVLGTSIINTNRGSMPISMLFDAHEYLAVETSPNNFIIEFGDLYGKSPMTVDSTGLHYRSNVKRFEVLYVKKHLVKKRMYKVSTLRTAPDTKTGVEHGHSVTVTEDHGVIVKRNLTLKSVKPTEILPTDLIRDPTIWTSKFEVEDLGIKEEWVYDLGVQRSQMFFANGILVHNSNYLTVDEIVKKYFPDKTFEEIAIEIEERIMTPLIDRLLKTYWGVQNLDNIINFKREGVIKDMIILAKKKYIKHIIQNEKKVYKTPQTKYTGVEVVRSDVPRFSRDLLDEFYKNIFTLDKNDKKSLRECCLKMVWDAKRRFKDLDIEKISFNSAVKEYYKYAKDAQYYIDNGLVYAPKTPVHVRASMNYNYLIKKLNLPYQPVGNGTKVKYGYVKSKNKKLIHQDVIAYIGNFPKEFKEIFTLDWKKQFENSYLSPVQKCFNVLGIGNADENENTGKFFEE